MRCVHTVFVLISVLCIGDCGLADEASIRTRITTQELETLVESLISDRQIITDLKVRVVNSQTQFDVTWKQNSDEFPWLIQINVNDREFKVLSKRYADDGFEMPIHQAVSVGRRQRNSAVWVQAVSRSVELVVPAGELPQSGDLGRDWGPLNDLILKTLQDNNIPGATVAVAHSGTLLYERGFGYADIQQPTAMLPDSTMRIASVSKPITAVAILMLVDQGLVVLDKPVLEYLAAHPFERLSTEHAVEADARWKQVTVRHLLQHSGGLDRDKSRDTMFQLVDVTRTLKLDHLARIPDLVRYQFTRPLDFEPGTAYVYSNVGYCLLGRVIEVIAAEPFEEFIGESILKPVGMTRTRLGRTRIRDRAADEVHYYTQQLRKFPAVWDVADRAKKSDFEMVEAPYGRWDLEVMDAHGGWTSSAADLVRFASAIDAEASPLLTKESLELLRQDPEFADREEKSFWYGLGWNVRPVGDFGAVNIWHAGSLPGTSTLLVRRWDDFTWAVLFNTDHAKSGDPCVEIVDSRLHAAIDQSVKKVLRE